MPSSNSIRKILVMKFRHIGDVLLTTPVFESLRTHLPQAEIHALVNSGTEEMLTHNPFIDKVLTYNRDIKRLSPLRRLLEELRFLRFISSQGYDLTIDLTGGDRPAVISLVSGAQKRIGVDPRGKGFPGKRWLYTATKTIDYETHVVLQNLSVLEPLGIAPEKTDLYFIIPEDAERRVMEILAEKGYQSSAPLVHIHPTSRWFFKCWPPSFTGSIIDFLINKGMQVAITSSEEEREIRLINDILNQVKTGRETSKKRVFNLSGILNLKELGAVSKRADLFFGIDSAPMHIAAAVGTPVIALFGPTRAFNWGPWPRGARGVSPYKHKRGIQRGGPHKVIQLDWPCIPCDRDGCNGSKRSRCLEEITP
ncbi:MAG: putative lipopolysaccharide heptosyltransferase III, partial [Nitrospirae bacterium]